MGQEKVRRDPTRRFTARDKERFMFKGRCFPQGFARSFWIWLSSEMQEGMLCSCMHSQLSHALGFGTETDHCFNSRLPREACQKATLRFLFIFSIWYQEGSSSSCLLLLSIRTGAFVKEGIHPSWPRGRSTSLQLQLTFEPT